MELSPRESIGHDADDMYDLAERLADNVAKLGAKAVHNADLVERLRDAQTVIGEALEALEALEAVQPTDEIAEVVDTPAEPVATVESVELPTHTEPIELESNEARAIIRRYFAAHVSDLNAWDGLVECLKANDVTVTTKRKLNSVVTAWLPQIEEELATIHQLDVRLTNIGGKWVAAEVARSHRPAPRLIEATPEQEVTTQQPIANIPPVVAPKPPVKTQLSIPKATPVAAPQRSLNDQPTAETEYTPRFALEALCSKITELPPAGKPYTRYNTLRNKLIHLPAAAAEQVINHYCSTGDLTEFRHEGARCVTPDPSVATALHTKPTKQGMRGERREAEAGEAPVELETAAAIIEAFLGARMHIEKALTYRELTEITGYDEQALKRAVKYLKTLDIVTTELRYLSRSGHRSGSQQVQKVTLTSQELKNQLKGMDRPGLMRYIEACAASPRSSDAYIAV